MPKGRVFSEVSALAEALAKLHVERRNRVVSRRDERMRRTSLTLADRREILSKTGGRCHICGGQINAGSWEADHILAHSTGGKHSVENYLPAHSVCNNYRWHYDAEEFQWILKLGVWMRTQIEKGTSIGREAGQKFCNHDTRRAGRRKSPQ